MGSAFPPSVQPGIPKLPSAPDGWSQCSLGPLLSQQKRKVVLDNNSEYELVTVKRARGGVISRGRLKGRQIAVKSQFEVKAGDFLISKRQIVHGACGIVPMELDGAIVSNEYEIFTPKPGLDLRFLDYLSHTIYFQQTCFHSSIGVHIEKMIFKTEQWLKWRFNLPTLHEQKELAELLRSWDRAIEATERLLENSKQRKKALMQQLLTGKKRLPGFEGKWDSAVIGEICDISKGGGLSKSSIESDGATSCVLYGELVMFYGAVIRKTKSATNVDNSLRIAALGDVLIPTSAEDPEGLATASCIMKSGVAIGGDVLILRPRSKHYHGPFLSYWLREHKKSIMRLAAGASISHVYGKDIASIELSAPAIEEQIEIAEILETAEQELASINARTRILKQEKKALMQQLLTGKKRVNVDKEAA